MSSAATELQPTPATAAMEVEPPAVASASSAVSSPFLWPSCPDPVSPSSAAGPTVLSNWVLPDLLCVGGYPSASELSKARAYAAAMAQARFEVYLNLMEAEELTRFRSYAELITEQCAQLQPPLTPQFLHFPLRDGGVPHESRFAALVLQVLSLLRSGRRMYVHCWGGHGRTGMLVSALLAVARPSRSPAEAMELCQRLHAARAYNPLHRSPEESQKPFVQRVVEYILALPPDYTVPPEFRLQPLRRPEAKTPPRTPTSTASSRKLSGREAALARIADRIKRESAGLGVIVVDPFGTASTTQASSVCPSTPLRSPVNKPSALADMPDLSCSGLLQRVYVGIDDHARDPSSHSPSALPQPFVSLQMNCLANSLATGDSFPHTAAAALAWHARRHMLLEEITGANRPPEFAPDVLTLQEVDQADYDELKPQMAVRGYAASVYHKKQSDSNADGVALFVRDASFRLLASERVVLDGMSQVAIFGQLAPLVQGEASTTHRLYVVSTHLKAKEGFEQLRLKQARVIMHKLQQFIQKQHAASFPQSDQATSAASSSGQSNPPHQSLGFSLPSGAALLFAGDLNDVPGSPVYDFLAGNNSLADDESDSSHSGPNADPSSMDTSSTPLAASAPHVPDSSSDPAANLTLSSPPSPLSHPFWLHSAYNRHYNPRDRANHPDELYTTVKRRDVLVQRCIDYIFYSPDRLHATHLLSIPNVHTQLPEFLPSTHYPSDHLAISARFEWKQ